MAARFFVIFASPEAVAATALDQHVQDGRVKPAKVQSRRPAGGVAAAAENA
jgi:hypothetical protein